MKIKPAPPAYTINRLSELTGIDRRTLKRRLANTPPKGTGPRKERLYTVEDAMAQPSGRSTAGHGAMANHTHYLRPFFMALFKSAHLLDVAVAEYDKFLGLMDRKGDKSQQPLIVDDLNTVTTYGKQVHEQLLGAKKGTLGGSLIDAKTALEDMVQRLLDVDATLGVTGFFDTPEGQRMRVRVIEANHPEAQK